MILLTVDLTARFAQVKRARSQFSNGVSNVATCFNIAIKLLKGGQATLALIVRYLLLSHLTFSDLHERALSLYSVTRARTSVSSTFPSFAPRVSFLVAAVVSAQIPSSVSRSIPTLLQPFEINFGPGATLSGQNSDTRTPKRERKKNKATSVTGKGKIYM